MTAATTASATHAHDDSLVVASDVLGSLTVARAELLQFPQGLHGFPECRNWVLVPTKRDGLFWLQSADHAPLAFLLVDPFTHFPGYAVDLSSGDLARVGTTEASEIVVLAVVTVGSKDGAPPTANLQGPVILNMRARHGHQIVLSVEGWGVREPFSIESTEETSSAA
jgi:flagellar assembly factor FliW